MRILCLDPGTSNIKAQIFDTHGPVSSIASISPEGCFDIEKGIIYTYKFTNAVKRCFEKAQLLDGEKIDAVGLITVGPTLAIFDENTCSTIARSYNFPAASEGVEKILKMDLYKNRGVGTGAQYTPEQIIQLRADKQLPKKPFLTSVASLLCAALGADIKKWTYPDASYNGLIDVNTGNYSKKIFKELNLKKAWFPKLTSGSVGYVSEELMRKLNLPYKKIPIFNLAIDGPATQAYFGKEYSTFKVESTCAFRVMGEKPIFDESPLIKGYPGVWNIFYKEPDGEQYFVSGSATNAGVNTLKYYFPNKDTNDFEAMDKKLTSLIKKSIPSLKEVGVEMPFEYGERDGISRRSGIIGKKPKNEILLYYALKEGVLFNFMQRVMLVRDAQEVAGNNLSDGFILTGPISRSKPWIDLALIMLHLIVDIKNPQLIKAQFDEIGLATVASGVFQKAGVEHKIKTDRETFNLDSLSLKLDTKKREMLLRRWEKYKECYNSYAE